MYICLNKYCCCLCYIMLYIHWLDVVYCFTVRSRNTNKMQLCNRIYYFKVFWRPNMFRAAHRSSSGVLNCICSFWFICPYDDRPLPRLSGKWIRYLDWLYDEQAHRSSSRALNCICSLWFIYPYGDRPLPRLSGKWIRYLDWLRWTVKIPDPFPTQPWQRPVTKWAYKLEAANTV
jgi:hypothetical protein